MKIKCIHTGDLHLGMEFKNASFNKQQANIRRLELWETFEKIVNRAEEERCNLLLIAGDLFEDDLCSIGDIKRINEKFKELTNTKVIISAGNHDNISEKSLYKLINWHENVHIFDTTGISKIEFEDINTVVWGYSWSKKEEKEEIIKNLKVDEKNKINILMIHADVINKNTEYLPIDKDLLYNAGFDYIALGHIHKPQFIKENISYCGSPEPLDFGETGEHGIVEGVISSGKTLMKFIPFSKRNFIVKNLNISEEKSYNDIINRIIKIDDIENRSNNFYRIILNGLRDRDINLNYSDLMETVKNEFYYIELIDNTQPDYDLERMEKENSNNIIGHFIRVMKEKGIEDPVNKKALYFGLEALMSEKVKK